MDCIPEEGDTPLMDSVHLNLSSVPLGLCCCLDTVLRLCRDCVETVLILCYLCTV